MSVSYKKLWKLLIDRDMKKKDLEERAEISHFVMHKLNHGENVTIDVLGKICRALDCGLDDIMEFVDEDQYVQLGKQRIGEIHMSGRNVKQYLEASIYDTTRTIDLMDRFEGYGSDIAYQKLALCNIACLKIGAFL